MSDLPVFVMERDFKAPPELVWRTWTEADLVGRWYGPGVETKVHEIDVREGGRWLHEMIMGERSGYQRMDYIEVEPPHRLVMLMSNTDADWKIVPNPQMPNWPTMLRTEVTFTPSASGTKMRLEWSPHAASAQEIETFRAAMDGLHKGWGAGMEVLETLLEEMQSRA